MSVLYLHCLVPPRRAAAAVAILVVAGCATFRPQDGPEPEPGGRYAPLTLPVVVVGDTQEHLATGFPLLENDSSVDAYVEVSQRPPEQPLFGRRILEWALQRHPGEPFLHLGDVLDLSCRVEARRIADVLRAAPTEGAILPGNHDGLMFGIYGYNVIEARTDPGAQKWNRACRRGAASEDAQHRTAKEAFTKRDFITQYLQQQTDGPRAKPGLTAPPAKGLQRVRWRNPDPSGFVAAIEAQLQDGVAYTDSFLLQRIRLPRAPGATREVMVIGLDTNQAGALVSTWDTIRGRSPGSMGHIRADQFEIIDAWVGEAIGRGDIVVFAGHHNWNSLALASRSMLRAVMARLDHPLVYLSAHTHAGFWAVHRALARRPLLELNVSSLSDWPIAYRRISFDYDEAARRLRVRGELMPYGDKPNASYADLIAAWEKETCAKSGLPSVTLRELDRDIVMKQRLSRGSLIEWLLAALDPESDGAALTMYRNADAYQDTALEVLLQASAAARETGVALPKATLPPWCGERDFPACAKSLMLEQPTDHRGYADLFRRKAGLVAAINDHLDRIDAPQAKAYMTCRAVQAAKIDFDATGDDRNDHRSEAKRRLEHFFLIEASVGMD